MIKFNEVVLFFFFLFLDDKNDVTTLDALGSHLSLVGNMDTMRIDIVVSEHGKSEKRKGKGKTRRAFVEINAGKVLTLLKKKSSFARRK